MPTDFDPAGPLRIHRLSRRSFLLQAGAVSIALALRSHSVEAFAGQLAELRRPNAWVTIGTDDMITLISPVSEMGQGVLTSIPLLIAEGCQGVWKPEVRRHTNYRWE
jgi:isoquinoline 1-oxidoreductase beta subunit